jgi:carbamoyl-phosphate synthase large subunit
MSSTRQLQFGMSVAVADAHAEDDRVDVNIGMPKRTDIKSILIIGAGPIVIGQACEFDYSGTQACKALRRRATGHPGQLQPGHDHDRPGAGRRHLYRADHAEIVAKIIEKERPDALLPTMGGQTALNTALALDEAWACSRSSASR